jgi:hypothetical protein
MPHATRRRLVSWPGACALVLGVALAALGASTVVFAQGTAPAPAPKRETPSPQDIDPAVNTSSPSQAPARDTPRPQDIDPAVNTSATAPANEAGTASSPATGSPAKGTSATKPSATGTSSAGAAGTPATSSTPNRPGSATAKPATGPDGKPRGRASDRLELDTTQITGNRELPKVLYIVPWKRADLGDLVGKPVNSLLDEVLTPVDRDVFKRENRYYRALTPAEGQPPGASPSSSSAPATGTATPAATSSGSAAPASRDER